jgi:hypothetical protein
LPLPDFCGIPADGLGWPAALSAIDAGCLDFWPCLGNLAIRPLVMAQPIVLRYRKELLCNRLDSLLLKTRHGAANPVKAGQVLWQRLLHAEIRVQQHGISAMLGE